MNDQVRADLAELLHYLQGAEHRAEHRGDERVADDPEANRYASEAGSLLATVDGAIERLEVIIGRLDREDV